MPNLFKAQMTAAAKLDASEFAPDEVQTTFSSLDVFRERCEARAILVEACVYHLQDAVDGLQEYAERSGLIDEIGQDAVQRMMADAFAKVRRSSRT